MNSKKLLEVERMLDRRGIMPLRMPSLEPMQKALAHLGFDHELKKIKNIIVAGTNGKGTTCAVLSALLNQAGVVGVGFYSSPHLVHITERIRINENDICSEDFIKAYQFCLPTMNIFNLTHFESLTLMAAYLFIEKGVNIAIWEVGLGGMFDATNAIAHDIAVITPIALDHQKILGEKIEQIAAQKFGVITDRGTVYHTRFEENSVRKVFESFLLKTNANAIESIDFIYHVKNSNMRSVSFNQYQVKGLTGFRAAQNAALAVTVFEGLGFEIKNEKGLSSVQVRWPGRFEENDSLSQHLGARVFLSGDHNEHGMDSLFDILRQNFSKSNTKASGRVRFHLVFSCSVDKPAVSMLKQLLSVLNEFNFEVLVYLTQANFKPFLVSGYSEILVSKAHVVFSGPELKTALECVRDHVLIRSGTHIDLCLITGSLYLIGDALKISSQH